MDEIFKSQQWSEDNADRLQTASSVLTNSTKPRGNQEPFGYFRAEPFGWTDCGENDEGAVALYDQETLNALQKRCDEMLKQRDELLSSLDRLMFAADCRDSTTGDQCRLMQVKAELAAASASSRSVIAKVKNRAV